MHFDVHGANSIFEQVLQANALHGRGVERVEGNRFADPNNTIEATHGQRVELEHPFVTLIEYLS